MVSQQDWSKPQRKGNTRQIMGKDLRRVNYRIVLSGSIYCSLETLAMIAEYSWRA